MNSDVAQIILRYFEPYILLARLLNILLLSLLSLTLLVRLSNNLGMSLLLKSM